MSVLASQKAPAKSSQKHPKHDAEVVSDVTVAEVQTEPIMVPFPLPAIGMSKPETKCVESVSLQTEYTWMFNEFPTRASEYCIAERFPISGEGMDKVSKTAELKKVASPKKKTNKVAVSEEAAPVIAAVEAASESEQMDPEESAMPSEDDSVKEPAVTTEEPSLSSAEPMEETQPPKVETPKKKARSPRKPKAIETVPATPASTAVPETPVSVSSPVTEKVAPKTMSKLAPVLSDSSDDDSQPLLHKAPALTRTITPMSVKPSIVTSTKAPVTPTPKAVSKADSESSESEAMSSSSDSDADVPAVSAIASKKIKKRKDPETPVGTKTTKTSVVSPVADAGVIGQTRMGPLVQVDDANDSHLETIHKNILDMIPGPLQSGAIKEAIFDESNNRLIFQLRITPKVVNFLSADGGIVKIDSQGTERKLIVLNEAMKKKASSLFKATEETPLPKRTRK